MYERSIDNSNPGAELRHNGLHTGNPESRAFAMSRKWHEPSFPQDSIIRPVRQNRTRTAIRDSKPIHGKQRKAEHGDCEDAIRHDPVDPVGDLHSLHPLFVLHDAFGDKLLDERVALPRDD